MCLINISFYLFAFIALCIVLYSLFQLGTVFWLAERLLDLLQKLQSKLEARRHTRANKAARASDSKRHRIE